MIDYMNDVYQLPINRVRRFPASPELSDPDYATNK